MKRFAIHSASRRAFTLAEMLTVIAIIAVLMTLAGMALTSQNRGRSLTKAGHDLAGVFEQARAHAAAANTYTWVGLKELSDSTLEAVIVASRNGNDRPADATTVSSTSGLVMVGNVFKLPNTKLVSLPVSTDRPQAVSVASATTPLYPFVTGTGTTRRDFNQYVVGFNNRGEVLLTTGTLQRMIEIGLQSAAQGTVQNANDYVAIQITGLAGNVKVYRP